MKKIALLLLYIISAINIVCARDIIVLLDTTEIEAMVVDIGQRFITYKNWSNQDGPIHTIEKSKVFYIKKEDGSRNYLSHKTALPTTSRAIYGKDRNDNPIKFDGYTYGGVLVCHSDIYGVGAGPIIDISLGIDFHKRLYIGAMFGVYTMFASMHIDGYKIKSREIIVPIPINLKFYFVENKTINPFLDCSIGIFIMHSQVTDDIYNVNTTYNGLFLQAGVGYTTIEKFSFSIGYTGLMIKKFANMGYIKLGVNF